MKTFSVTENSTLKNFTDGVYPQGSFVLASLLKKGDVRVNGEKVRSDCPLACGDQVVYYTTPLQEAKPSHSVLYQDQNLLVADKFCGVSSEGLFYELKDVAAYPVHRLDRNTCGVCVIAKTQAVQAELIKAFKNRLVEKVYLCYAKNAFKRSEDKLCAYLCKNPKNFTVKVYSSPRPGAVQIKTDYKVIKSYGDYALVKVILHTGKTHQIRAHLSFIGCPVLGDTKYGDFALNKKYRATRQILVAKYLKFNLTGKLEYLNSIRLESGLEPKLP